MSEAAIEHIRYISVLAEQSEDSGIHITIANDQYAQGITGDIYTMIEGFGIDRNRIQITSKTYLGEDESQFIKITIAPNKNSWSPILTSKSGVITYLLSGSAFLVIELCGMQTLKKGGE